MENHDTNAVPKSEANDEAKVAANSGSVTSAALADPAPAAGGKPKKPKIAHPGVMWLYIASAATSALGNSLAGIVFPWLVLRRTGDPAAAGIVAAVISIPALFFAFVGGNFIDRFGRKRMSVISDFISALSVVLLIVADSTVGLVLWLFIAIGIFGAVGDVPGMAARNALAGDVAKQAGAPLDRLAGLLQGVASVFILVGPILGGTLLGFLPMVQVLWITAGCSFVAAILTALLRLPAHQREEKSEDAPKFDLKVWREIIRIPIIKIFCVDSFFGTMAIMPYLAVILPAHFERIDQPTAFGVVSSGFAIGMMAGSLLVSRIGVAYRRRVFVACMVLNCVAYLGIIFLHYTPVVMCGFIAAGLAAGFFAPLTTVLVTETVSEDRRGRAFSIFSMIELIAQPIGLALTTAALTWFSIYQLAVFFCVAGILSTAWVTVKGVPILPAGRVRSTN